MGAAYFRGFGLYAGDWHSGAPHLGLCMDRGNSGVYHIGRTAGVIHGNEQHDPYNGEAGGSAASFCRIARQVGKCESAMDGIYFCGIFRDPIGGLVLEERLRADRGRKV